MTTPNAHEAAKVEKLIDQLTEAETLESSLHDAEDDVLATLLKDARRSVEAYELRAKEAADAARAALAKFEDNPDEESALAERVAAQVAKNARADVARVTEELAPLFAEERRRKRCARLEELRKLDVRNHLPGLEAEFVALFGNFNRDLQALFGRLGEALRNHEAVRGELTSLETDPMVGGGVAVPTVRFKEAILRIRETFAREFGDEWNPHTGSGVSIRAGDNGRGYDINGEVRFRVGNDAMGTR